MLYELKVPVKLCKPWLYILIYPCLKFCICHLKLTQGDEKIPIKYLRTSEK